MRSGVLEVRACLLVCVLSCVAGAHGAGAQVAVSSADGGGATVQSGVPEVPAPAEATSSGSAGGFFGRASDRRRVIPAFWGMHFFDRQSFELFWTKGAGVQYSGWFGAAFVNSYDHLSLIAGIERDWARGRIAGLDVGIGYRAGLLSGYDGQLIRLAEKTPVLPFAGLHVWVEKGPFAVDAFYVYRALAFETSIGY